ncbi:putative autophagy protein Atg22 [Delphinella strobiligena]|nr:putative autophagy protein Atg22 [Delphinella strobiligena]
MSPQPIEEHEPGLRYPGEDNRSTSSKELLGFYAYSFAAEVFIVCGIAGSFIPITLEQLARERGVLQSDRTRPCIQSSLHGPSNTPARDFDKAQCIVAIPGLGYINTASFAMYTFSVSVLVQAVVVVTFSGAADHGRYRKTLLLSFAIVGAVVTMLFLPINSDVFLLGALWAIIGNVCCASSFVLLNSFLPLLVRWHPATARPRVNPQREEYGSRGISVIRRQASHDSNEHQDTDESASLLSPAPRDAVGLPGATSPELQLSTKISSYGVGIGYIGAVTLQTSSIFIVVATGSTTFSLRLVLFLVGLWWLIFTTPAALWLRPRPGPPLASIPGRGGRRRSWVGFLSYSWVNLGRTVMRARRLKDVLLFLAAWFMISDAIATVSGTAVLFAKTTLGMHAPALAAINVITTFSGVIGAFTWSKVSRMMQLTPSQTIFACICLFELIPLYGLLGFIPAVRRAHVGGLQQPWEMYPLGAVYGLVLGGLGSYCRSLFGELIPPGSEAAFYALYAVTDKGSSVFGPVIVGMIIDATGDIRPAFWFLAALIALPLPLVYLVDVKRGKREGTQLVRDTLGLPIDSNTETQAETGRVPETEDGGGR